MKMLTEDNRPDLVEILTILQEEAAEVSQAAAKLIRFGLTAQNPLSVLTNVQELAHEMTDIMTVICMITDLSDMDITREQVLNKELMNRKIAKIAKHSTYWQFQDDDITD
jgi:NTP pyrophosphatase (non-canonical NTP hydrolase)